MLAATSTLWEKQDKHSGDRARLFRVIGAHTQAERVLYPGSYVDVAPSFVFPQVTYVDVDRRSAAFFRDSAGVREIIAANPPSPAEPEFEFFHQDYTQPLDVPDASYDLLVSLYAGFISQACVNKLRIGGLLLANASHGDAAMASMDDRFRFVGVVILEDDNYRVETNHLDAYLQQKKSTTITRAGLREWGKGLTYTKSAFAYLFERTN
ncbi:hypothetical protein K0651_08840 [Ornithinimicrobium sp. Arc0846-15]|nr:hypothetical protein [Ornithinimicrobium laminariae]